MNAKQTQALSDLMLSAYSHQKNDELSKAIQAWNALLQHPATEQSLQANAHLSLGQLHQLQGNNDLAFESLSKAIEANPNSAEAYYCLAYLAQGQSNFDTAIDYFKQAIALNSKDVGAWNNLGNCYDELNQTTQSIDAYTKAIDLDGDYIAAIYNRANVYIKRNQDDLALKDLNKAIELDENFYQAYYNLSVLLKRMGKLAPSKQALVKSQTLAQQDIKIKTNIRNL